MTIPEEDLNDISQKAALEFMEAHRQLHMGIAPLLTGLECLIIGAFRGIADIEGREEAYAKFSHLVARAEKIILMGYQNRPKGSV